MSYLTSLRLALSALLVTQAGASAQLLVPTEIIETARGPRIVVYEAPDAPLISMRLSIGFDATPEHFAAAPVLQALAESRLRGTAATLGARIEFGASEHGISYIVTGALADLDQLAYLLRLATREPRHDEGFTRARAEVAARLTRVGEVGEGRLEAELRATAEPGAPSLQQIREQLRTLSFEELRAAWRQTHRTEAMTLVVDGDVSMPVLLSTVAGLAQTETPPPAVQNRALDPIRDRPNLLRSWLGIAWLMDPGLDPVTAVVASLSTEHLRAHDGQVEAFVRVWEGRQGDVLGVLGSAYDRGVRELRTVLEQLPQSLLASITQDEVTRVAARLRFALLAQARTPWGRASLAGRFIDGGGAPDAAARYLEALDTVTVGAIRARLEVMSQVTPVRASAGNGVTSGGGASTGSGATVRGHSATLGSPPRAGVEVPPHVNRPEWAARFQTVTRSPAPVAGMAIALPVGSGRDPAAEEGSAAVVAEAIASEIEARLGSATAEVVATVEPERIIWTLLADTDKSDQVLKVFGEVVFGAGPSHNRLEQTRQLQLERRVFERDSPLLEVRAAERALLFGEGDLRTRAPEGSVSSLAGLDPSRLQAWRREHLRSGQAYVVVVGPSADEAVGVAAVGDSVDLAPVDTARIDPAMQAAPADPAAQAWRLGRRVAIERDVTNGWLTVAWPVPLEVDPTAADFLAHRLERELNPLLPDPGLFSARADVSEIGGQPVVVVRAATAPEQMSAFETRILSLPTAYETALDDVRFLWYRRQFRADRLIETAAPEAEAAERARQWLRLGSLVDLDEQLWMVTPETVVQAALGLSAPRVLSFGPRLTGR